MNKKIIFALFVSIAVICLVNSVCAHEAEYPEPYIENPKINSVVSGDVDFEMTIDDHHETLYVNVTATHMPTNTVYFHSQDNNPSDGWSCKWDTSDAPNGKYYVSAVALNSANLKGQYNILITLNNTKQETNIVLDDSIGIVDKQNTITAHLLDNQSNPLSNKDLDVAIGDESYNAKTTNDGVALISFTPKEAKQYNISVKFNGDNVYAPAEITKTLNVLANSTLITVEDIVGNNRQNVLLKAGLKNYLGPDADKKIDFYVDSNKVGSALTDESGNAEFNYTIEEKGGKHIYSAQYLDEFNTTFKASAFLYVPQSSVYVKIAALTYSVDGIFTFGNKFKVTYTVFNDGPDAAENTIFRYAVPNSIKYASSKASQGNVTFNNPDLVWQIGNLDVGSQTLDVEFVAESAANNNLAPEMSTATYDESIANNITRNIFSVKSYEISAKNLVKYYTSKDKFQISIRDGNGTPAVGAVVKITFGKQTFDLATNSKGIVSLDTKDLNVGKYTIKAVCNSLSTSKKITVKPLLVTKNISVKKAKKVKFTAKLLNNKGKIVKNKKVTFKVDGKTIKAKTNSKGIATATLTNLKVGKHKITTSYGKSSVKNTITIKK